MTINNVRIPDRLDRTQLSQAFWDCLEEIAIAQYVHSVEFWQSEKDNPNSDYSKSVCEQALEYLLNNVTLADMAEGFVGTSHYDVAGSVFADIIVDGKVVV